MKQFDVEQECFEKAKALFAQILNKTTGEQFDCKDPEYGLKRSVFCIMLSGMLKASGMMGMLAMYEGGSLRRDDLVELVEQLHQEVFIQASKHVSLYLVTDGEQVRELEQKIAKMHEE